MKTASIRLALACAFSVTTALAAPPRTVPAVPLAPAAAPAPRDERVAVTIYEFRSSLPAMSARTATDMFTTALVQTGRFRVVERARMNEGVVREKQLQQAGWASGTAAQRQLRGADYVFEGTVSEANIGERSRSAGVSIGGMQVGGGSAQDSIVIDVRVIDAANGEVADALTVRKPIASTSASVSGVGNLLGTVLANRGRSSPYTPDLQAQSQTNEGVDSAVRAAIDEAVQRLAQRFSP